MTGPDALARVRTLARLAREADAAAARARAARDAAMSAAITAGVSGHDVAAAAGMTPSRVYQIHQRGQGK